MIDIERTIVHLVLGSIIKCGMCRETLCKQQLGVWANLRWCLTRSNIDWKWNFTSNDFTTSVIAIDKLQKVHHHEMGSLNLRYIHVHTLPQRAENEKKRLKQINKNDLDDDAFGPSCCGSRHHHHATEIEGKNERKIKTINPLENVSSIHGLFIWRWCCVCMDAKTASSVYTFWCIAAPVFHPALEEKVIAEMLCIMCLIMDANFIVVVVLSTSPCWCMFLMTIFLLFLQIFHVKNNLRGEARDEK